MKTEQKHVLGGGGGLGVGKGLFVLGTVGVYFNFGQKSVTLFFFLELFS